MRVVLVGARGQLGTALSSVLSAETVALGRSQLDVTEEAAVEQALGAGRPDCVINTSAYNFVDRAEDEPAAAFLTNAVGPRNLARWCEAAKVPLVHVSTDYAFGLDRGRKTPYRETDEPGPTSVYAVSKLAGEWFVRAGCSRHFIVRTCGLYGHAASDGKGNFVKTMLRLASEGKELTIVDDQRCTPSSAVDVAAVIARLIETKDYGTYHATNAGETNWYAFARAIFRAAGLEVDVKPIKSAEYPQKALRPRYSVLDCGKLSRLVGGKLPPWEEAVTRYVQELTSVGPSR